MAQTVAHWFRKWMWALAMLGALGARAAHAQVNVTLRGSASVAPADAKSGSPGITLADVADLDPPASDEATKLAEIVVSPARDGIRITITDIRNALDAAKVNWGRITLRGTTCQITMDGIAPPVAGATAPLPVVQRLGLSQTTPQSVILDGPEAGTLKGVVSARLVELYNVDPADLRLAFDPADEEFLTQTLTDRRVDVQPTTTANSARTPVNVYIYEGDRLAGTRLVSVQALINRTLVTARAPIMRGQPISAELVEVARQWVPPNAKPSVNAEAAIGQLASRSINVGSVVTLADVTAPVVCKRGDTVWVHVLSGPVTVKAKCLAQGQARDGELVQLKLAGSDRLFMARMSGPGLAVMVAGDEGEQAESRAGRRPARLSPKGR